MKVSHFALGALCTLGALMIAVPAFAQSLKNSPLFETVLETKEAVYYTPAPTSAFKEANADYRAFRSYPAPVLSAAKADCSTREGELRTCATLCGLNGCFSGCQLACVFPEVTASSTEALQATIADLTEDIADTDDPKEQKSLSRDLANYREKFAKVMDRMRAETEMLNLALAERQQREIERPSFAATRQGLVATTSVELRTVVREWQEAHAKRFSETCSRITDPAAPVRGGFAPPFNLGSGSPTPLIDIFCDTLTPDISVKVGSGEPNTYIYEKGYRWENGKWMEFDWRSLSGPARSGWISGGAFADLTFENADDRDDSAVVAYVCAYQNNAWQCGCTDGSCSKSRWQIQEVEAK